MLLRPRLADLRCILYYVGRVVYALGVLMLIPAAVGACYGEWSAMVDFLLGCSLAVGLGSLTSIMGPGPIAPAWVHGMVVSASAWLACMVVGCVPNLLSGHYACFLDACFDLMSGYTTTGLILIQDLDHISHTLNTWRHLVTYAGGQGIVVIALTFLIAGGSGAFRMYVGEAKDERLRPNVVGTARAIWAISLVWLVVGSGALLICALGAGVPLSRAWLQAVWMFMSAWSTGGFAPYSQNALYWHSLSFEMVNLVIFVAGSFNFALHYALWTGRRREILRNVEIASFTATVLVLFAVASSAMLAAGMYPDLLPMLRVGFFQLVSAHTTTGLMTIYGPQFYEHWPLLATAAVMVAMMVGGSAASTAGGFKGLRVGLLYRALVQDVKQLLVPEGVRTGARIHHIDDIQVTDRAVRTAALVVIAYVALFAFLTLVACGCGFRFDHCVFEAASVTGNVGLSCGLTTPDMPAVMKLADIFGMWAARLEFAAVNVLAAFAWSAAFGVRGRTGAAGSG